MSPVRSVSHRRPAPTLFIETDIQTDVDDVAALALAMNLQRRGLIDIAGVGVNTSSRWGARAVDVLKALYGGGFPVGVLRPLTDDRAERDFVGLVAAGWSGTEDWPDAPELLLRILEGADDASVTVVSIGFFGNLVRFLALPSARELVRAKVAATVVMGGRFPTGSEFNFQEDASATRAFLAGWPTAIDFIGFEAGAAVITGRDLDRTLGRAHPVSVAFRAHSGAGTGRSSWDAIAVFSAAFPEWDGLIWSPRGEVDVNADGGANGWTPSPGGRHRYASLAASPDVIAARLDEELIAPIEDEC